MKWLLHVSNVPFWRGIFFIPCRLRYFATPPSPTSELSFWQSRPHCLWRVGYRSDCDWTGVPLFSLWVMAKSEAIRYFQSVMNGSPPFIARRYLAGHGVPLHTLMLITITKRKYLANGYSVVKDHSRFRHTKQNRWKEFNPSHLFAHLKAVSYRLKLKFFKKFF